MIRIQNFRDSLDVEFIKKIINGEDVTIELNSLLGK
jgi:hypothetical protein